jgi:hypothetical protein
VRATKHRSGSRIHGDESVMLVVGVRGYLGACLSLRDRRGRGLMVNDIADDFLQIPLGY